MKVLRLALMTTMLFAISASATGPASATEFDDDVKRIAGAWRLDLTDPDGVHRTPIILVGRQNEELVAWYVDGEEPEQCKDVHLEGETLLLTIQPREFDKDVTVTFEGELTKENQCAGTAKYASTDGDSGSLDFSGARITPAEFRNVNRWALDFTTPDDERRKAAVILLSSDEEWYGWYSSDKYELPVREITNEAGRVVFSVSAKTDSGAEFEVTFRGDVEGESIRGNAEYDLEGDTGSFSFTGRKQTSKLIVKKQANSPSEQRALVTGK